MLLLREEPEAAVILYFDRATERVTELERLEGWSNGSAANLRALAAGTFLLVDRTLPRGSSDLMQVERFR